MLIKKNFRDRKKCIYECDRCKRKINYCTRYQLYVAVKGTSMGKKYADLCERCMNALNRGMKKESKGVVKEVWMNLQFYMLYV